MPLWASGAVSWLGRVSVNLQYDTVHECNYKYITYNLDDERKKKSITYYIYEEAGKWVNGWGS